MSLKNEGGCLSKVIAYRLTGGHSEGRNPQREKLDPFWGAANSSLLYLQ